MKFAIKLPLPAGILHENMSEATTVAQRSNYFGKRVR